uniref:Uncharacterized protein n=1 Tax=Biomphalaria glabrata TaxID=6526 RepID=A0A2C9LYB1_BIOGL
MNRSRCCPARLQCTVERLCPKTSDCHLGSNDYQFRYNDGLSSAIGAKKTPLVYHCNDMDCILSPDLYGHQRPARQLGPKPVHWWPSIQGPVCHNKKPESRARFIGLHYDITRAPPTEYEIQHF